MRRTFYCLRDGYGWRIHDNHKILSGEIKTHSLRVVTI